MSHFCVLVIGEDVEGQLAPYQENNRGDCPKRFLEFEDCEDEYRREYETEGNEMVRLPDGSLVFPWDERFRVKGSIGTGHGTHHPPDEFPVVQVAHSGRYATFEAFVADWHGLKKRDPETGHYGYWRNPNERWDWWVMGGRYSGRLKLKSGADGVRGQRSWSNEEEPIADGFADQAKIGDLDWDGMAQHRMSERVKWWVEYEKAVAKGDSAFAMMEFGVERGQTREQYIEAGREFSCFAVVKNGKWYERGAMGWWGIVSNEKDASVWKEQLSSLLADLPPETLLTIVDCHI